LLLLTYAGPATADIPDGWSNPAPVPVLHDLLVLIGIPVLITLGILAAVYLPGVVRGESVAPAGARSDDQWFGGRRDTAELPPGRHAAVTSTDTSGESGRDTGGASGSW
jgi:hypothetical protein